MINSQSPLPPQEAAKLIKFYLNLYPDLVGTLKEYFPKQITKKQTTFNRTIKVAIPKDIKTKFAARLVNEMPFLNFFFQGYYLMVPYHSEAEYQRLTRDITKLAKEFGVKGLSFRGIKGVIQEQKAAKKKTKRENKPMLTKVEFAQTVKKVDDLLDNSHIRNLSDSEQEELHKLGEQISKYETAITVPDIYGVNLLQQLMYEYKYTQEELIEVLGKEAYTSIYTTKQLTELDIKKLAKWFNLPESVFYPEIKEAA